MDSLSTREVFAYTAMATAIIGAIGQQVANVVKEWRRVASVGDKLDRATEKLETNTELTKETANRVIDVSAKASVIKASVDGTSHAQAAKIDAMQAQLDLLHKLLAEKEKSQ